MIPFSCEHGGGHLLPHPPATPGSPDVVVSQLLQDLRVHLVLEGLSPQGTLKDLVSELVDGAHPLGRVVAHVLERGWEAVKEGLVADKGRTGPGGRRPCSPTGSASPSHVALNLRLLT